MNAGIMASMRRIRKITVEIPEPLLRKAQKQSREGVTGTVRRGLQLLAAAEAYEHLRRLRGAVRFSIDLNTMRKDRK